LTTGLLLEGGSYDEQVKIGEQSVTITLSNNRDN
jgi:hypothetical protein